MKAIVVGRHTAEIPGVEIVESRAVTFPARSAECLPILQELRKAAEAAGACVLLQNTPGQVAVALAGMYNDGGTIVGAFGVVVSKPGERLAGVEKVFHFSESPDANEAAEAVKFANPRAKAGVFPNAVKVVADPPMVFEFSHIEWF